MPFGAKFVFVSSKCSKVCKKNKLAKMRLLFIFIDSTGTEEADSTRTRRGDHNSPLLQGYERVRKFGKKAMFQVQLTNKFFPNEI